MSAMELQAEMPAPSQVREPGNVAGGRVTRPAAGGSRAVMRVAGVVLAGMASVGGVSATGQGHGHDGAMVVIDTDIGDDIGDAFAVGLALSSPELNILGITSAFGDTALRARLLDRLLCDDGVPGITVATGVPGHRRGGAAFTQARFAAVAPRRRHPAAVDFLLSELSRHPGDITVIAIAPLTNLGAAFERDPATFRKLKRIVMMGGSIHRGYDGAGGERRGPDAEYNIAMDVAAARVVFNSGVPVEVMPLDATQQRLDVARRRELFAAGTGLAVDLEALYRDWAAATRRRTPILYDLVAVAHAIDPTLCPAAPMRIEVDDEGFTRSRPGPPNSRVCLGSQSARLLDFYMPRLMRGVPARGCRVGR